MFAERRRALAEDRSGATAAEFALVLPVFTIMILAGLQFGWGQHSASGMNFAMEQASRALLLSPSLDETALRTMVRDSLGADTAAKVDLTLVREAGPGGSQVARLTGVYTTQIGIPSLAAIPFKFTRTVSTPLPVS